MSRREQPQIPSDAGEIGCERGPLGPARLVVLVPYDGVEITWLARRVWNMAITYRLRVLFLGLSGPAGREETGVRLSMITLAAMTRDGQLDVETRIVPGSNWVYAVQQVLQPGDLVICQSGQTVHVQGSGYHPLVNALETMLGANVYVLMGRVELEPYSRNEGAGFGRRVVRLFSLIVPFVVIAAFFLIQVRIEVVTAGLMRTVLLCASGLLELGALGWWGTWAG